MGAGGGGRSEFFFRAYAMQICICINMIFQIHHNIVSYFPFCDMGIRGIQLLLLVTG